jgi:hypothetical protein
MLPLGMVVLFIGYGTGSYGWIVVKGYNITLREWFSPLHPYQGPLDGNGCVPQGSLFAKAGQGGPCKSAGLTNPIQKQQRQNLRTQPNPHGYVQ